MPELPPRNCWYRIKWRGERQQPAWAEKYFDNHSEAFDYAERRRLEHPTGRVSSPVHSHEAPAIWAVCVDPV
jgi:hypothetical protein